MRGANPNPKWNTSVFITLQAQVSIHPFTIYLMDSMWARNDDPPEAVQAEMISKSIPVPRAERQHWAKKSKTRVLTKTPNLFRPHACSPKP
jgi:hypothetical protein